MSTVKLQYYNTGIPLSTYIFVHKRRRDQNNWFISIFKLPNSCCYPVILDASSDGSIEKKKKKFKMILSVLKSVSVLEGKLAALIVILFFLFLFSVSRLEPFQVDILNSTHSPYWERGVLFLYSNQCVLLFEYSSTSTLIKLLYTSCTARVIYHVLCLLTTIVYRIRNSDILQVVVM